MDRTPCHPLLALQRFTLCDLELACTDLEQSTEEPHGASHGAHEALRQMEACSAAVEVGCATHSELRLQATERLEDLRRRCVI